MKAALKRVIPIADTSVGRFMEKFNTPVQNFFSHQADHRLMNTKKVSEEGMKKLRNALEKHEEDKHMYGPF